MYDATEIEGARGVVVWLAHLPDVTLVPMHLQFERTEEGVAMLGWPESLGDTLPAGSTLLLLADPYSFPTDVLLTHLNRHQAGIPVFGGMASGPLPAGDNRLIFGDRAFDDGAVGVLIHGNIRVRNVVSQGCRPIGRPFVVTKGKTISCSSWGVGPRLATARVVSAAFFRRAAIGAARAARRPGHQRISGSIPSGRFPGPQRARNRLESRQHRDRRLRTGGQTVQFHVRDATTADEDLHELLLAAPRSGQRVRRALVFTCNGRGSRLFPEPHHDAQAVAQQWAALPTAGFFRRGKSGLWAERIFCTALRPALRCSAAIAALPDIA